VLEWFWWAPGIYPGQTKTGFNSALETLNKWFCHYTVTVKHFIDAESVSSCKYFLMKIRRHIVWFHYPFGFFR